MKVERGLFNTIRRNRVDPSTKYRRYFISRLFIRKYRVQLRKIVLAFEPSRMLSSMPTSFQVFSSCSRTISNIRRCRRGESNERQKRKAFRETFKRKYFFSYHSASASIASTGGHVSFLLFFPRANGFLGDTIEEIARGVVSL